MWECSFSPHPHQHMFFVFLFFSTLTGVTQMFLEIKDLKWHYHSFSEVDVFLITRSDKGIVGKIKQNYIPLCILALLPKDAFPQQNMTLFLSLYICVYMKKKNPKTYLENNLNKTYLEYIQKHHNRMEFTPVMDHCFSIQNSINIIHQ